MAAALAQILIHLATVIAGAVAQNHGVLVLRA